MTRRIQENLVPTSLDKIKMLTREDIVTYGKAKGSILDAAGLQLLPPEDPRKALTEDEMMARSAADRLFEMHVLARRAKKEKITKLEEDSAAKATEDQPAQPIVVDNDAIDAMIYLLDYPQTKAEAFALAKCGYAINGVFEVNEIPKADAEEVEDEEAEGGSDEEEDDDDSPKSKKAAEIDAE